MSQVWKPVKSENAADVRGPKAYLTQTIEQGRHSCLAICHRLQCAWSWPSPCHLPTLLPCSAPHVLQGFLGYGFRPSKTSGVNLLLGCFQALHPRGFYACERLFVFLRNQIRFQIETALSFKACLSACKLASAPSGVWPFVCLWSRSSKAFSETRYACAK